MTDTRSDRRVPVIAILPAIPVFCDTDCNCINADIDLPTLRDTVTRLGISLVVFAGHENNGALSGGCSKVTGRKLEDY